MGQKPFRIANTETRDGAGRYAERFKQPTPPELVKRAAEEGVDVQTLLADPRNRAMDHPSVGGQPGKAQDPWGPPVAPKPPMRLKP